MASGDGVKFDTPCMLPKGPSAWPICPMIHGTCSMFMLHTHRITDMSDRRSQSNRPATLSPLRQGRYRPVRSPLVSMGPSLVEERRRRRTVQRALLLFVGMAAIGVGLALIIVALGHEVVVGGSDARSSGEAAVTAVSMSRPDPLRLAQVPAEGTGQPMALQLPINLRGVTGIGYGRRHDSEVLDLEPEGSPANMPGGERMLRRFLATRPVSAIRWFSLTESSSRNIVYVGAQPGSQVVKLPAPQSVQLRMASCGRQSRY